MPACTSLRVELALILLVFITLLNLRGLVSLERPWRFQYIFS